MPGSVEPMNTQKRMQEISIELQIANRNYPLRVNQEEADSALKAAELINQKLKDFEEKYGVRDIQDLFAMSALQIATQLIDLEKQGVAYHDQVIQRMKTMENMIDEVLSDQ
jgi:cell division protein ZapA